MFWHILYCKGKKRAKTAFLLIEIDFFNWSQRYDIILVVFWLFCCVLQILCWNMKNRAKTVFPVKIVFFQGFLNSFVINSLITCLTSFSTLIFIALHWFRVFSQICGKLSHCVFCDEFCFLLKILQFACVSTHFVPKSQKMRWDNVFREKCWFW